MGRGTRVRILGIVSLLTGLACSSCSSNSGVHETDKAAEKPTVLTSDVKLPLAQLPATPPPTSPIGAALSRVFAKRVEFGKKTGVFLDVAPDAASASAVLAAPASIAASLVGNGSCGDWVGPVLACRPPAFGGQKRVAIPAAVCLRSGFLEHLLSHGGKRHESIVFADVDASIIHAALLAIGAKPGKPVQFENVELKREFRPATGDRIRVMLEYEENGSRKTVLAQKWIRFAKTKKELNHDWVFAGSYLFKDPDGNPIYAANEGRFICVTNFSNALLDVPFQSQDGDPQNGLDFEANTEAIPPVETRVLLLLEPLGAANSETKK